MTLIDALLLILLVGLAIRFATRRAWDKHEVRLPPKDRPIDLVGRSFADRERR